MHDSAIKHGGGIKLWEVSTGREIRTLAGHESSVQSVAFSADGRYAISGGYGGDDTIKLWDLSTGKEVKTLRGHSGGVSSVALSPDGRYALAGGSDDQTVKLWEVSTGRELRTLSGHASSVRSVAFSPDGRHIFSGSFNGDTRTWNLYTGDEICTMVGFNDGEWIAITPEGYYNSSLHGHKYLNVRMGMKVYGIDQFYDVFYRPDILMAKLKGEDITPLVTLTINDAIKNPLPEVDFTTVTYNSTSPQAKICYQAKDTGGGIGEVRLFHNGKLIKSDGFYRDVARTTAGKIQLASLDGKSIREDMRSIVVKPLMDISTIVSKAKGGDIFKDCVVMDAVPGENEASISAFNKDNTVQSYLKTTGFTAHIKAEDSHLYMMIVGID
ncbi:MAG: WD40 repeat domain-containing protein, partial [Syntrophales bacterium LBB04]|nr:WD40 repeat domain-containing protein [Syntrophales bacterium LBB04]